jgi:hypothetical protein
MYPSHACHLFFVKGLRSTSSSLPLWSSRSLGSWSCCFFQAIYPRSLATGARQAYATDTLVAPKQNRPPLLGWDTKDVWKPPLELPPCPSILHEDVTVTNPAANIIDGKAIAQEILWEISKEVEQMKKSVGKVPGLAVVLVGSRTDSETYVRSKKRACEEVGFQSFSITLPEESPEAEVVRHVKRYDDDPLVHGVLVQLPLPQVVIFLLCCMTQFFPVSTIRPSSVRIWDLPRVKLRHVLW